MYCIWKSNLILLTFLFMKLCICIFVFSFSYCVLVYLGFDCSIYNFQMCNLILLAFVGIRNQAFCLSDHFSTPTWPHHHHHHHHHRCITIIIAATIACAYFLSIKMNQTSAAFSCPGQRNKWPCHWLTQLTVEWVNFDFSGFRPPQSCCRHACPWQRQRQRHWERFIVSVR